MSYRLTLPVRMQFTDWAHQVLQDLEPIGLSPISAEESDWRSWATSVCQLPVIAGRNPPNPQQYSDWQVWAENFTRSVY
jgi:hypothetical protein